VTRGVRLVLALIAGVVLTTSCAYYNTFYLARKYYERGAGGLPYPVEKASGAAANEFRRSIDYSKKLLSQYPKSKWVDDAYLLWARALLGRDDPLQTVNMLEDFATRYPESERKDEALFYLGVGYRNARTYGSALAALDTFLVRAPRHDLVPYAQLERSRALFSLERFAEAADAAGVIVATFPKSGLLHQAYTARAEALLQNENYEDAQQDFRVLGQRSRTDEERLGDLQPHHHHRIR
jgi:outer membrane protein assembly factor BamD (BamD/ComL family)